MTIVKHRINPKTGDIEVAGVVSDVLGLFGSPTVNATGSLLYDEKDLEEMGYYDPLKGTKNDPDKYGSSLLEDKLRFTDKPYKLPSFSDYNKLK
jgi:hypothetical protein